MAGDMLHDRQHSAIQHRFDHRAAQSGYDLRIAGEGAIADHPVRVFHRDIKQRYAIHIDAEGEKVFRNQSRIPVGAQPRVAGIVAIQIAEPLHRRTRLPVWRLEARDSTTFLVDQNRRARIRDGFAQRSHQRPDLLGIGNIAGEQDKTPRLRLPEEAALVSGQLRSGAAIDRTGATTFWATALPAGSLSPSAFSFAQAALASARLENGPIRKRYQVPLLPQVRGLNIGRIAETEVCACLYDCQEAFASVADG